MKYLFAVLTVIAAYLIGSINFAVIFSKHFSKIDVREYGSGNAGTTNVLRVAGMKAGVLTFVADALKGAIACIMGYVIFEYFLLSGTTYVETPFFSGIYGKFMCGLACMVGHCFPVFFQFKGGKAAATSVGIFAVCSPIAILLGLIGFALTIVFTKIVSLGSIIATVIVAGTTAVLAFVGYYPDYINPYVLTAIMVVAASLVIFRHAENIKRLINGTEKKISVKKEQ